MQVQQRVLPKCVGSEGWKDHFPVCRPVTDDYFWLDWEGTAAAGWFFSNTLAKVRGLVGVEALILSGRHVSCVDAQCV